MSIGGEITPSTAPAPDWEKLSREIQCPLCDYNLRGLVEPRCPECGCTFAWGDVLDPSRRVHPYLFEHQRRRRIVPFFKTLAMGVVPWRFWSDLHATHQPRMKRLILYWVLSVALVPVWQAALFSWAAGSVALSMHRDRVAIARIGPLAPSQQSWFDTRYPPPFSLAWFERSVDTYRTTGSVLVDPYSQLAMVGAIVLWPWLIFITLLLFRDSMRQAKVRPVHLLRSTLYCCDGTWILLIALAIMIGALGMNVHTPYSILLAWYWDFAAAAAFLFGVLVVIRLTFAGALYLRFTVGWAIAVLSQVIVYLVTLGLITKANG
jgi:hypothetical protein